MMRTAFIKVGGRQYVVKEGDHITLNGGKLKKGETLVVKEVLALDDNGEFMVGKPFLQNWQVLCEVGEEFKGKKVIVFKKKAKKNYKVKRGHRQKYFNVLVKEIKKI